MLGLLDNLLVWGMTAILPASSIRAKVCSSPQGTTIRVVALLAAGEACDVRKVAEATLQSHRYMCSNHRLWKEMRSCYLPLRTIISIMALNFAEKAGDFG